MPLYLLRLWFQQSKFGNIEAAGKFIDKNRETLKFFSNYPPPPSPFSPSLFRLITFQKLSQQLTLFF